MVQKLSKFLAVSIVKNQDGATMVEYAIMLVSIGAVCIVLIGLIGEETLELFQTVRW